MNEIFLRTFSFASDDLTEKITGQETIPILYRSTIFNLLILYFDFLLCRLETEFGAFLI